MEKPKYPGSCYSMSCGASGKDCNSDCINYAVLQEYYRLEKIYEEWRKEND